MNLALRKVLQSPHNQINDQTKNMKNFKPNPSSKILEEKEDFLRKEGRGKWDEGWLPHLRYPPRNI